VCFNLSGAASVPNLTRRRETAFKTSPRLERDLAAIMQQLAPQAQGPTVGAGAPRTAEQGKNKNKG
jgi:hypothetical protein